MKKIFSTIFLLCFFFYAFPQEKRDTIIDIYDLFLEELMKVEITTVSKIKEKAGSSPATVIVISEEVIKMRCYRSLDVIAFFWT